MTVPGGPTADEGPGLAEGEAVVAAAGGGCDFISSRRSPLSVFPLCAYRIERAKVRRKNIAASQPVIFVSTFVVCAPKMFSVTPPPKAAPRPSLFGRCIRITRIMSKATKT